MSERRIGQQACSALSQGLCCHLGLHLDRSHRRRRRPPSLPPHVFFSYFYRAASITLSVFSCPLPEPRRVSEVWQSDKPVTDFPGDCSQTCLSESVCSGSTARLWHQSPINILGESILGRTLRGAQLPSLRLISGTAVDFLTAEANRQDFIQPTVALKSLRKKMDLSTQLHSYLLLKYIEFAMKTDWKFKD